MGNTYRKSRGKCMSMAGRGDFEQKSWRKVGVTGVFLSNKNENQYSGFS